jgi:DNA polymerase I
MLELYASGDPYLNFAKIVGAVPQTATKTSHAAVRDMYKVVLLATQYGMQAETLAARLSVSIFEAYEMLNQHRSLFAPYWRWSDDWVAHALDTGKMSTVLGWECTTGITELSERSIRNWPIQATGAEILRIACIMAERHGIEVVAPVHDAVLIESSLEHVDAAIAATREIMRRASRIVLNATPDGPHELRTSVTAVRFPDRYRDDRGEQIWNRVLELLAAHEQREEAATCRSA